MVASLLDPVRIAEVARIAPGLPALWRTLALAGDSASMRRPRRQFRLITFRGEALNARRHSRS